MGTRTSLYILEALLFLLKSFAHFSIGLLHFNIIHL